MGNFNFKMELREKLRILSQFGITSDMIPENYFASVRSQRDLDVKANALVSKWFLAMEAAPEIKATPRRRRARKEVAA